MPEGDALWAAGPASRQFYRDLLSTMQPLGVFRKEVKKTSVHLVRNSAFVGVHPRKQHLLLTIKAQEPIRSERILKAEQISKTDGTWS